MKSDSIRLAWAGAMIGVLVLSATVFAKTRPPARRSGETGTGDAQAVFASERRAAAPETAGEEVIFGEDEAAVPVMAERTSRRFPVVLRLETAPEGRLFLCEVNGCPLEEIRAGAGEEAKLGPLAPGEYSLCQGGIELGRFRLLENAELSRAEGLLRSDGETLYLRAGAP